MTALPPIADQKGQSLDATHQQSLSLPPNSHGISAIAENQPPSQRAHSPANTSKLVSLTKPSPWYVRRPGHFFCFLIAPICLLGNPLPSQPLPFRWDKIPEKKNKPTTSSSHTQPEGVFSADWSSSTSRMGSCKDLDNQGVPKYPVTHRMTSFHCETP